jgi:hypothetical protein
MKTTKQEKEHNPHAPWRVGKAYFVRTVTHHYTGKLVAVHQQELVLTDVAWIADDGRFTQALAKGEFNEVEPFPDGEVIIGRGAILDASIFTPAVPRSQK